MWDENRNAVCSSWGPQQIRGVLCFDGDCEFKMKKIGAASEIGVRDPGAIAQYPRSCRSDKNPDKMNA